MTVPFWVLVLLSVLAIPGVLMTLLWVWASAKLVAIYLKEGQL
jgi:hypothetical protein